jgi:hypothetical protein
VTLSAAETEEPRDIHCIRFSGSQRMAFDRLKTVATANGAALGENCLVGHRNSRDKRLIAQESVESRAARWARGHPNDTPTTRCFVRCGVVGWTFSLTHGGNGLTFDRLEWNQCCRADHSVARKLDVVLAFIRIYSRKLRSVPFGNSALG